MSWSEAVGRHLLWMGVMLQILKWGKKKLCLFCVGCCLEVGTSFTKDSFGKFYLEGGRIPKCSNSYL